MDTVTDIVIVEDDLLIAETISETLSNAGYKKIRIVDSVDDAVSEIEKRKPHLVLTDIELGSNKNGIDLAHLLHNKYQIPFIFITSHSGPEIINKAKHTRPNAYIVKPFKSEDLIIAIELAKFNSIEKNEPVKEEETLTVKEGRAIVKLSCKEVQWLEASGNYTVINLSNGKRRVIRDSLSEFEKQLNPSTFIRIHKSYLVNKTFVKEVHTGKLILSTLELPIGRTYQTEVNDVFAK